MLRSWANQAAKPIPLVYHVLERLLSKGCRKCSAIAAKELEPGRGECRMTVADIDEAIRGLSSNFLVTRQHAVCVLGDRSLGKAAAKIVLPALVGAFHDKHPNVRRLAVVNLSLWKAAAKPYRSEIRKLLKDEDASVRTAARYALSEL